ncbi:helix-turn-helix transcriptional regulator [Blastococcus sp. TML/M2B]|uniref:helix-turn-helix transcriptional regulator n=1 Tax=Blastococcus sp. TML/M2B TaxID=2798727 RepID=UPI00190E0B4D|nr:helix-turn-helix transcriptional regulator [Blastococcus sp. TML/M2B]MBN1093447.1 helix-turn-helix transcriptional regulator [Blastococcus sp. TML/M2B]
MNAVRRLRTDRGLSQRRLAAAIGVDPLTVKRLEAGADPGDLPLRVIERLAHTLAAPLQDLLLPQHRAGEDTQLGPAVGAALLAHGRTTVTALATALHATVAEVTEAIEALNYQLPDAGIAVSRHHDDVWLVPHVHTPADVAADRPLTLAEARLLRRIQRGEDVRRKLSRTGRELTLPALHRRGLVEDHGDGPVLAAHVATSLETA